jgi:hypothetical protein
MKRTAQLTRKRPGGLLFIKSQKSLNHVEHSAAKAENGFVKFVIAPLSFHGPRDDSIEPRLELSPACSQAMF